MKAKHLILLMLTLFTSINAFAEAVEIDGIWYNLVSKAKVAEVTSNPNKYTGTVIIPGSVTYDGVNYSVTSIGNKAFEYCNGMTSIAIPNSVTTIGEFAFWNCVGLSSVTIPNSVTSICYQAFTGCSNLTSIILPNSVTSIDDCAFQSCSSLTSITIPSSVTSIGGWTFRNCTNLSYVIIPNSVTSIGQNAFESCTSLKSVAIGNSVASIGSEAFKGCSALNSIIIGIGVKSIYNRAFAQCTELSDVYCYAENVPSTYNDTFDGSYIDFATLHVHAASLEAYSTTAPWSSFGTIVAIEDEINNITFADANVKAICVANWDTNHNGELSKAEAASVTDLGEVFRGNTSITSFNELQYFTGLTSIGDYAFRDCIALTSIILPESVTTIKGGALRNTAITTLTIPASVTSIEVNSDSGGVTEDCSSLMNIHVEEGNSRYYSVDGVVFTEDEELVGINGKAIVMFPQGRSGSYEIPSGVTIVGPRAFVSCKSLTSVSIPNFMTNIGNCSFFSCYSLADVWCYAETIPTISSWAFEGSPIDFATLHVPASSLQAYKATTPWKDFGTIIAIDEEVSTETVKIASAADLANFANRVNAGENKLNAVLTADIDFTTYPDVMIENRYYGEFDGRGHSIKLKLNCKGLFCYLSGYVHDLITLGSITTSEQFAGGIASQTEKCTIERCQIKMFISSTVNGDGTHGGIVGVSHEGTLIRDCIFCGSIRGNQTSCCGGLSGWADGTTAISNCLIKSTFSVGATNSDKLARNPSNVISSNNYFCGTWDAANNCSDVTLLTNNQVKSGEACYRLNNGRVNNEMVWYQTLGEDTYPVPDNRHLPISLVEDSYINDRIINFADANVKAICVANWDTNGDGELSEAEAAAVPDLGEVFKGNTTITSFNELQYFTRLTSISNLAFNNCSALKSVTIPNSVTSIGERAFSFCSSLTAITIPNSVTSIGDGAFWNCSSLTSITIPNSVTSIGNTAFYSCSSLTSITIPNSVTSIGNTAFSSCSSLTYITIPNSVTSIGNGAFQNCSSLTSITIPNSVTSIGNGAFRNCSSLTSIIIPDGVTSIGSNAFKNCSGLTSITIPDGVTSIGNYAFSGCSSLTSITIPNSVTSIGAGAFSSTGLTTVTIGESVESIGEEAFLLCKSLTSITIPNSVTSIGAKAFGYTGLTTVTIGESVESIGEDAFHWCLSLKEIYCNAMETPDVTTGTFRTVKVAEVMLVVPDEAVELYKAHDVWKQFWIETPTVIPSMEDGGNKTEDGSIYNLSGQSLGKIQKGIYIKGGKKIISK